MKKGKFAKNGHRGATNKPLALLLSLVLIVGCVAGGTLAWLLDTSGNVVNNFTPSTLEVKLEETTGETYKMIPGWEITKDPKVTLTDGSEDSIVFVKVVEENNTIDGLAAVDGIDNSATKVLLYTIDSSWKSVAGYTGVYYQEVTGLAAESNTDDWTDYVIADNKIVVNQNVTKGMMDGTLSTNQPKITITAYAHQLYKSEGKPFTAAEAWANLNP